MGCSRIEDYIDSNGRAIVIGDGTGTGKSRSIATEILSVVAVEDYLRVKVHPNRLNGNPVCIWFTLGLSHIGGAKSAFRECLNMDRGCDSDTLDMNSLSGDVMYVSMVTLPEFLALSAEERRGDPVIILTTYTFLHNNLAQFTKALLSNPNTYPSYVAFDEFHQFKNISSEMRAALSDMDNVENRLHEKRKYDWLNKLKKSGSFFGCGVKNKTTNKDDISLKRDYEIALNREVMDESTSLEREFKAHFNVPPVPGGFFKERLLCYSSL